jgi:hypothetical protein
MPALEQTTATAITPTDTGTPSSASIPDFSGSWSHASLNGLQLPQSGPGPVKNTSRLRTGPQAGVGNMRQLVGDYTDLETLGGGGREGVWRDFVGRRGLSDPTQPMLARTGAIRSSVPWPAGCKLIES